MSTLKLDLQSLLAPIAVDNPRGGNMEFDAAIDAIREARENDPDDLPFDEWSSTPRKADWQQVIRLSQELLSHRSKDLQVACWLCEALLHQHGLIGLAAALEFMQAFIQAYGDTCWPEPDEDDESLHDSKLQWLDRQLVLPLIRLQLLGQPESSLSYWRQVQEFEHKVIIHPEMRDTLLKEGDFSLHRYLNWASSIPSAKLAQTVQTLNQVRTALLSFELSYKQYHGNNSGDRLRTISQTLNEMDDLLQRLGKESSPDYNDIIMLNVLDPNAQTNVHISGAETSHQSMSRDLAISQMLTIAHFFRQSEPSSPVPFLMERGARWANMTLTEWLDEMLQDDKSMHDINQVLKGNNT